MQRQYGVSTQRIKEVNSIMGSSIVQYSSLIIPPDEHGKCSKRKPLGKRGAHTPDALLSNLEAADAANVQQRRLIALRREMSLLGGGGEKEAAAYLSMADNDADVALAMFKADMEWHRTEGSAGQESDVVKMLRCVAVAPEPKSTSILPKLKLKLVF